MVVEVVANHEKFAREKAMLLRVLSLSVADANSPNRHNRIIIDSTFVTPRHQRLPGVLRVGSPTDVGNAPSASIGPKQQELGRPTVPRVSNENGQDVDVCPEGEAPAAGVVTWLSRARGCTFEG